MHDENALVPEIKIATEIAFNEADGTFSYEGKTANGVFIIGPRSSGKTTLSNEVSTSLGVACFDLDIEIGRTRYLEDPERGLREMVSEAITSGNWENFITTAASIVRNIPDEEPFVMAIAAGVMSPQYTEVYEEISSRGITVSILPGTSHEDSLNVLYAREKERIHHQGADPAELKNKTEAHLSNYENQSKGRVDVAVYVGDLKPSEIAQNLFKAKAEIL